MHKLRHTIFFFFLLIASTNYAQVPSELAAAVDSIVSDAIKMEAFPGCVLHVTKGEEVIFHQAFGYHTYDSVQSVRASDIYDIASITKVAGATLVLMKMYEDGHYKLDDKLGDYIPKLGRKVGRVTFREALAHQGGLYPWIPFHKEVKRRNGKYRRKTIAFEKTSDYGYQLSDRLFLHSDFYSRIKKMIRKSDVDKEKKYRYSGLFFYLVPELVLNLTDTSYSTYLETHFYAPMNADSIVFNPLEKFSKKQLVPTEIDTFFRQELIHGKVHDEGAIMMEGVSGNAGLFSNSNDLVRLFQMLMNGGRLDSASYLHPATVALFTTTQYPANENRRALGFDKPLLAYDAAISSVAKDASTGSFGHTGYTGALAWADPENDLIFVFLTNRVYPNRLQKAIYELNVRPTLHQLFYDFYAKKVAENSDPVRKLR